MKYSYAFVIMPGGAGTIDEMFEALTLIQTRKIKSFPVVIMGTDYWDEILPFIDKMAKAGMIAPSDLKLVHATNSVDDAIAHIRTRAIERFGLRAVRRMRHHWRFLGERGLPPPLAALRALGPLRKTSFGDSRQKTRGAAQLMERTWTRSCSNITR